MIVAGIDIGAGATKAVILENDRVIASEILLTGHDVEKVAGEVMRKVVKKAGISTDDLQRVVSTGYGRHAIDYADRAVSEIICHARGVNFVLPDTEVIVDIGCQDSKIIRLDHNGNVTDFSMNDKCAAGTGRFLEVMANALGLAINEIGPESGRSENPCHISSTCTVFAESEVITLRARGASRPDLVAGIHQAIAKRVLLMATNLKGARVVFTGGVAKNSGVQRALEAELGQTLTVPEEPQLTGALGAACIALQECLA
jgi:predicted CoA-substrate-specific enzyme activase